VVVRPDPQVTTLSAINWPTSTAARTTKATH
jgi:hypothetical protein